MYGRGEDVTLTLYKDTLRSRLVNTGNSTPDPPKTQVNLDGKSKVNKICDAMIRHLENEPEKYMGSVLTAYVQKTPPDLESALRFIQQISPRTSRRKKAIKVICFLMDVNQVFDTALGLYDLDLAVEVAHEAQKVCVKHPFLHLALKKARIPKSTFHGCGNFKKRIYTAGSFLSMTTSNDMGKLYETCSPWN
jgi:hypothetical protein